MLSPSQSLPFPTGSQTISKLLYKNSISFTYLSESNSQKHLIQAIPTSNPHLQDFYYQSFTNQKLIPHDQHILTLYDHFLLKNPDFGLLKLEYCENGTLKDFMKTHELNEDQILYIFKDILLGVIKINDNGIVHTDLNPMNIWIDEKFTFKIGGFERSLRNDEYRKRNFAGNMRKINHPVLRPPEKFDGTDYSKYDIWGLGCLLYYLVYRDYPFGGNSKNWQVSEYVLEMVNMCLEPCPDERPLPRKVLNMVVSKKIPTLPFFFKSTEAEVFCIKYSAKASVKSILVKDPCEPDPFYLQQLIFSSQTHPIKIPNIFHQISSSPQNLTIIALKSLIILQKLLISLPPNIIINHIKISLENLLSIWSNNPKNPEDSEFCEYFSGLIRQLSRTLLEKISLHTKTGLLPSWKGQIKYENVKEVTGYLGKIVRICEGLAMGKDILPRINRFLALQLIDECEKCIESLRKTGGNDEIQDFLNRIAELNIKNAVSKADSYQTSNVPKFKMPKNQYNHNKDKVFELFGYDFIENKEMSQTPTNKMGKSVGEFFNSRNGQKKVLENKDYDLIELDGQNGYKGLNFDDDHDEICRNHIFDANGLGFQPSAPSLPVTGSGVFVSYNIVEPSAPTLPNTGVNGHSFPLPSAPSLHMTNMISIPNPQLIEPSAPSLTNTNDLPVPNPLFKLSKKTPNPSQNIINPQFVSSQNQIPNVVFYNPLPEIVVKPAEKNEILQSNSNQVKNPFIIHKHANSIDNLEKILSPKSKDSYEKAFFIEKRWLVSENDIKLKDILGCGASCIVYHGEFKRTPVAVKVMKQGCLGKNIIQEFQREVSAMVKIRHPNLVLFMGACVDPTMMIVSEYCAGGSLFSLLHETKTIQLHWQQKAKMIIDIARGMLYLHEANPPIIHRDLKSLNLLLLDQVTCPKDYIQVKIADFGISRILDDAKARLTIQMGTCHWMAPEVLNGQDYSLAADVYSFGIVLWEITARDTPYRNMSSFDVPLKVLQGERPNVNAIGTTVPDRIKDLIRACWDENPEKRPSFRQVLQFLEGLPGT